MFFFNKLYNRPVNRDFTGENSTLRRKLTVLELATLIFFEVSGGPYGIEEVVRTGGPLFAIIGLIVAPVIWSIPIALMTAELSSNYPHTGGQVFWAYEAFGSFWGFQLGLWSFIGNVFDTAVLPVMCIDYLRVFTGELSPLYRWSFGFAFLFFILLLNLRGIELVGKASMLLSVAVLFPFVVFVCLGVRFINVSALLRYAKWSSGDFQPFRFNTRSSTFLTVLLWNLSGYDMAGACAGEVADPEKSFPKSIAIAVVLSTFVYLFPVIIGVCVPGADDYKSWKDGYFTQIAKILGGKYFGYVLGVVGMLSSLGMLNSLLMSSARELYCMGDIGVLPAIFGTVHPIYRTPHVALAFLSLLVSACLLVDFDALVQYSTFIDAAAFILEFAAFLALRRRRMLTTTPPIQPEECRSLIGTEFTDPSDLLLAGQSSHQYSSHESEYEDLREERVSCTPTASYNVPGGIIGVCATSFFPYLFCTVTLCVCNWETWIIEVSLMLLGTASYFLFRTKNLSWRY